MDVGRLARLAALVALGLLVAPTSNHAARQAHASSPDREETVRRLLRDGYYIAAESSARVLMDEARVSPGKDSLRFAAAGELLVDATCRQIKAQQPEAGDLAEGVRRIRERVFGSESLEHAAALMGLGEVCRIRDQARVARSCFERALAIRERSLGPEHADVATSLTSLARVLSDSNAVAANPLFERALAIREKVLPPDHPDLARGYHFMAWSLRQSGRLKAAKAMFERALTLRERILRPGHPDIGHTLHHYGACLRELNDLRAAQAVLERALSIRELALGPQNTDVGWSLFDLGFVAANSGDYALGRERFERAIAIFANPAWPAPVGEGRARAGLGYLLTQVGEYVEARRQFELGIAQLTAARGPSHGLVMGVTEDFGTLLLTMGDYMGARDCFQRARAAREKTLGSDNPRMSFFDLKLGSTALSAKDYPLAESLLSRSVAIKEKAFGPQSPDLVAPLLYLGTTCIQTGDLERGRGILQRARRIEDSTRVHGAAGSFNLDMLLARADHLMGEEMLARDGFRRAITATMRVWGPADPNTGDAIAQYADFLVDAGPAEAALDSALVAETICRDHFRLTARGLSEQQALNYASARPTGLPAALTLAARGLDGPAGARVWDSVIRSRALVLDEMAARRRGIGGGPHARALTEASVRLANLTVRGPVDDVEGYRMQLKDAREAKERAERELGESAESSRDRVLGAPIGFAQVAEHLPPGSALVAYVVYEHRERRPSPRRSGGGATRVPADEILPIMPRYLAFVLRGGERIPEVVPLGTRARVDSLAARWGGQVSRGSLSGGRFLERNYRPVGEALRQTVWDPVSSRLGRASRVFVVPDGALNLVNLATLPVAKGGYLVESGPLIHLLSTERDLVTDERLPATGNGLLSMGGADFDGAPPLVAEAVSSPGNPRDPGAVSAPGRFRGERSWCSDFQSLRWMGLPGTLAEVKDVAAIWQSMRPAPLVDDARSSAARGGATVLVGAEANERAFKDRAPGMRTLHLATHGFFLDAGCTPSFRATRGLGSLADAPTQPGGAGTPGDGKTPKSATGKESAPTLRENPLHLSGIVLAGANHRQEVGPDEDDGVLTAEEISTLDLRGVEWAVLSACETGVGEVRSGEGVFGLRRAFQVAGARTSIMSLWSVDDDATRAWMRSLFEARLKDNLGTAEAVRAASLAVLRERRARGESAHPFFWGAFVAAGDWH